MEGTNPIHQFNIVNYFTFATIGGDGTKGSGIEFSFTNSGLFMIVTLAIVAGYLIFSTRGRGLVPSRLQLVSEMSYEFIANTVRSSAGTEGMRIFPFVFTLFAFLLVGTVISLMPYFFTITAQVIITSALALLVIAIVVVYGFMRNGLGFLKLFAPKGIPLPVLFLVVPIEILSFISRPVSLSLRLFGNMLAGHIVWEVFAGFVVMLSAAGALGMAGAVLPLGMAVAIAALELLVAALQAYVFTILTCVYLADAIHPGH